MTLIKFPENRISELVRKTLDGYNAKIMRGWTKERKEKELPSFMPYYTGKEVFNYGFGEMEPEMVSYVPFGKLDQLDIDNPECVNHDLYMLLRRFKRERGDGKLDEREVVSTFNNAYAYTLDALNHSHPEARYNEYFEEYIFFHADVEVIKAFVYVLLSGERHRFAHTALLLEDLEYNDKVGTIQYFAKGLGIRFAASATGPQEDEGEQNADAPPRKPGAKPKPMIFKDEAETLRWAEVVNETLADVLTDRFVNSELSLQLAAIVCFDHWWGRVKNIYPNNKIPSTPVLFDFFRMHCGFTATANGKGEYKTAYNGINKFRIHKDNGKPDEIKEKHRSLWNKIKDVVQENIP